MITKTTLRSCCGGKAYILQLQKPIRKDHMESFEKAGYETPAIYKKAGLFYVQKKGLAATASYGSTKIQLRVNNRTANAIIVEFENLLDSLTKNA